MSNNQIGQKIKGLRIKAKLTQKDFACKADVKYTALTKIESGIIKSPFVQVIVKIAKALNASIEKFTVFLKPLTK
ncbi:MAG: helix-turn-helix transcriptional regulator [Candidatus Omnitrophica bacterium]|nr:helix-turn-helix transcriptional regulator [Candidatus Omnitrophota bacterium]